MNSLVLQVRSASKLVLALAPLMLIGGQALAAGVVEINWDAGGHFDHSLTVVRGKVAEVCGKLPPGLSVRWEFGSDVPMDFNIHYHSGKDVVFPTKLKAVATADGVLETKSDQSYCWMWTNASNKLATLTLHLAR